MLKLNCNMLHKSGKQNYIAAIKKDKMQIVLEGNTNSVSERANSLIMLNRKRKAIIGFVGTTYVSNVHAPETIYHNVKSLDFLYE